MSDFDFLGSRIEEETEVKGQFNLYDKRFASSSTPEEKNIESILLRFKQKVRVLDETSCLGLINRRISFDTQVKKSPIYIHEIIYNNCIRDFCQSSRVLELNPTLSFRTLILNSSLHLKFGLPIKFGGCVRALSDKEILDSLFISDYLHVFKKKLEFIAFSKVREGYSLNCNNNYGAIYREFHEESISYIPSGNYLGRLLLNIKCKETLSITLIRIQIFLKDLDFLIQEMRSFGLGLELHGQNLLVKFCKEKLIHKFLYRDYGSCTVEKKKVPRELIAFYENQGHSIFFTSTIHREQIFFKTFLLGFIVFNIARVCEKENLSFDTYKWFSDSIKNLRALNEIYR